MTSFNMPQHRRLTIEEILDDVRSGWMNATQAVRNYILVKCAPGWTIKLDRKQVCSELGISQMSFYRTILKMREKGEINWNEPKEVEISRPHSSVNPNNSPVNPNNSPVNPNNSSVNPVNSSVNPINSSVKTTPVNPSQDKTFSDSASLFQIDSNITSDIDQLFLTPPTHPEEEKERENLSTTVEILDPEPEWADGESSAILAVSVEAQLANPKGKEDKTLYCEPQEAQSIPCPETKVITEDKLSPARSIQVTRRKTDAHFGQKQNALTLHKQRAAEEAIAGSPFASIQQQDEFFMAVMKYVRSNSSRLEQGSVEAIATKIVRNVTSGKTEPKDRFLFEAWENGNLSNLQNLDNTRKEFKKQEHYAKAMQILAEIKED